MKIFNKIYDKSLNILGDIKVVKYPFWFVYDPDGFDVSGQDMRDVISILQEGDILLRFYNKYLDGKFIKGVFSHAAYYIGKDTIVHAVAEGVLKEDILEFLRCDGIAVMRFKKITKTDIRKASTTARKLIGKKYDFEFETDDDEFYCTEAVKEMYKHKSDELGVMMEEVKMLGGLLKRHVIIPDSFYQSPALDCIFINERASRKVKKKIGKS